MKFIVSSGMLQKELQNIAGVINSSNTLPILDNFLFKLEGGSLKISASDLESTMITSVNVSKGEKDGAVCIPAKILLDSLKTFAEQPLSFDIDEKNFGVEISSDNGKYRVPGVSADEFPKLPEISSSIKMNVSAEALFGGINKCLFATGNDELRPVMSGIFFEIHKDKVVFVATDAHKLVKYERSDLSAKKEASFILPKKPNNILKSLLGSFNDDIEMIFNDTNAQFVVGNIQLICRLIDGKYPNYEAVIPKENPNKLTIDRQLFLNTIKRISLFSNKTTHQVRLKVVGSELSISAEDLDFSNEAHERLTCNYEGEDMEIGFNSRFLIEMLSNIESDNVSLEMSAPNRAGILVPGDDSDAHEHVIMLVMPVMLNS